jgi:hypothetical protein
MRCWQMADGSTETQVASVAEDCKSSPAEQKYQCAAIDASFKSIYSFGTHCINFENSGKSLNCIQAARDHENAPSPTAPATTSAPFLGSLSFGAFIAIVVVGGAFLLAVVVGGAILAIRYRNRNAKMMDAATTATEMFPLSPSKKPMSTSRVASPTTATPRKGRSAVQSQALENAVNDFI